MRKFNITVNGKTYEVEVEELAAGIASTAAAPAVQAAPPVQAAPAQAPQAAPSPAADQQKPVEQKPAESKPSAPPVQGGETVSCPMPGTILSVNVKPGDSVKKGEVMCILEAMKMENEIMAPRDGVVAQVGVSKGSSVNTGDMLVVLS